VDMCVAGSCTKDSVVDMCVAGSCTEVSVVDMCVVCSCTKVSVTYVSVWSGEISYSVVNDTLVCTVNGL